MLVRLGGVRHGISGTGADQRQGEGAGLDPGQIEGDEAETCAADGPQHLRRSGSDTARTRSSSTRSGRSPRDAGPAGRRSPAPAMPPRPGRSGSAWPASPPGNAESATRGRVRPALLRPRAPVRQRPSVRPPWSSPRRRAGGAPRARPLPGHPDGRAVAHRRRSPRRRSHPSRGCGPPRRRWWRTARPCSGSTDRGRWPDTGRSPHWSRSPRSVPRSPGPPGARPRSSTARLGDTPSRATTRPGPRARAARASRTEESTPPEKATPSRSTPASWAATAAWARGRSSSTASLHALTLTGADACRQGDRPCGRGVSSRCGRWDLARAAEDQMSRDDEAAFRGRVAVEAGEHPLSGDGAELRGVLGHHRDRGRIRSPIGMSSKPTSAICCSAPGGAAPGWHRP